MLSSPAFVATFLSLPICVVFSSIPKRCQGTPVTPIIFMLIFLHVDSATQRQVVIAQHFSFCLTGCPQSQADQISAVQEKNTTNSTGQEDKPQPSQSSSPNRCFTDFLGEGTTDADYFIHRGGVEALQMFNSCSLYEEKHELKYFCRRQLRVHSKGRQCFMEASLKPLRTLMCCF